MTPDRAREILISAIDHAAYRETDSSLYDADKNRLFGSEHYQSSRPIYKPSPWSGDDFEGKMAQPLAWSNTLNRNSNEFLHAIQLLESEDSVLGRIIRRAKAHQ